MAGDELKKAIKRHGSLQAAEAALAQQMGLDPNAEPSEPESIGNLIVTPSAELRHGMLIVKGALENGRLARPSIEVPSAR